MNLRAVWDTIAGAQKQTFADFRVRADRVIGGDLAAGPGVFTPRSCYFEIRISQFYLRDRREYWREFTSIVSVMTDFLFEQGRQSVPIVVGPQLLGDSGSGVGSEIEYPNIRVAGPFPYYGDELVLLVRLSRVEAVNWAQRSLSIVETIVGAFDSTRASAFAQVGDALVSGVQGFLGMERVEERLGMYRSYSRPAAAGAPADSLEVLAPSYEVLIRVPSESIPEPVRSRFWVRDGKLYYGEDADHLAEYRGADFMLVRIAPLSTRDDYHTFAFHTKHWPRVQDHIWAGRADDARGAFRAMAADLMGTSDIIQPQKMALLTTYRTDFDDMVRQYAELGGEAGHGFEAPARPVMGAAELKAAAAAPAAANLPTDPDAVLAGL